MAVLGRIVRHELRSLVADPLVWIAGGALVLLSGYAVLVGVRGAEAQRDQVNQALEEEAERYEALRETLQGIESGEDAGSPFQDPSRPYVLGRERGQRYAVLPAAPFQVSAVGQSDLIPAAVPVILDGADPRTAREEIENPVHLLTGPLDLAFLVTFLLPLITIALSFDLLSREREDGTLAVLLSQPLSVRRVVTAKVLARWVVLLVLAVGSAALALIVLGAGLPPLQFLLWTGVVALYLAFWLSVAALVNATGRDSARNAVVLAFLWLAFAVLVPAGIQISAGLVHRVPSRAELMTLERAETQQVEGQASAVLAQYYDEHPDLLPDGSVDAVDYQTRAYAVMGEVERRLEPVRAGYEEQLERQQAFIRSARWLSPATVVFQALIDLAGTGDQRVDRFQEAVKQFHAAWIDFFEPLIYADARLGSADLAGLPEWTFRDQAAADVLALVVPGLFGLLLFTGIAGVPAISQLRNGRDRKWTP